MGQQAVQDTDLSVQMRQPVGLLPGLMLVVLISLLAWGLDRFMALPAVIGALLLGLCFSAVPRRYPQTYAGVKFAAEPLMKTAVACLGAGVNIALLMDLGWPVLMAVCLMMATTLVVGIWLGRLMGRTSRFAILSAGAVAICGSSAAMALCCALPSSRDRECDLSIVIIAISLLSAIGLLLYPLLTQALALNEVQSGFVLGGSLHNVAQAVAAGFTISETAGDTATLVKMMRVIFLAPIVMIVAWVVRYSGDVSRSRKVRMLPPLFLIAFISLMIAGSAGWIPGAIRQGLVQVATGGLIMAMAAIGLMTSVSQIMRRDRRAFLLIFIQTGVMLGSALFALLWLGL